MFDMEIEMIDLGGIMKASREYSGVFICPQTTVPQPRRVFSRQVYTAKAGVRFFVGSGHENPKGVAE